MQGVLTSRKPEACRDERPGFHTSSPGRHLDDMGVIRAPTRRNGVQPKLTGARLARS